MVLDRLERLARRRMHEPDRRRQDAFRRDIESSWCPTTAAERRLALRSQLVHLGTSLFGGGVTLAEAGVAGLLTTLGSVIITVSSTRVAAYDSDVPLWVSVVLTLGILAVALESARSPLAVHRATFPLVALPLSVGAAAGAVTMGIYNAADAVLCVALAVVAAGMSTAGGAALARRPAWLRRGLVVAGVGALGVCFSDGAWTAIFAADGDTGRALGCACSACGSILMANGLLFARPALAR